MHSAVAVAEYRESLMLQCVVHAVAIAHTTWLGTFQGGYSAIFTGGF